MPFLTFRLWKSEGCDLAALRLDRGVLSSNLNPPRSSADGRMKACGAPLLGSQQPLSSQLSTTHHVAARHMKDDSCWQTITRGKSKAVFSFFWFRFLSSHSFFLSIQSSPLPFPPLSQGAEGKCCSLFLCTIYSPPAVVAVHSLVNPFSWKSWCLPQSIDLISAD